MAHQLLSLKGKKMPATRWNIGEKIPEIFFLVRHHANVDNRGSSIRF
jgi:hypothetical protein